MTPRVAGLERHLEKVINQRIQREEVYSAEEERKIIWFEGSRFRGLSAFQPEHARCWQDI
jgi:hypothetical protein